MMSSVRPTPLRSAGASAGGRPTPGTLSANRRSGSAHTSGGPGSGGVGTDSSFVIVGTSLFVVVVVV